MTLAALTQDEREVVRRTMEATFRYFDVDFHTRLGVRPEVMRSLLDDWPSVDDSSDDSHASVAINNALNDLLHGVAITEDEAREQVGVSLEEMERVYEKWCAARGWSWTGLR